VSLKARIGRLEEERRTATLSSTAPPYLEPVAFARSLGVEPDAWQADLLRSDKRQVAVCCSRQCGKSSTAALKATHRAVYHPGSLVLVVSPSQRQSNELFRKVSLLVRRLGDVLADPPELVEDNKLSLMMANGSRIVSLPDNPDTVRGFSAVNLLIEDEAAFVRDDLNVAVRPMLATTRGQLVLMSTPFGKRGHFYEAFINGGAVWERMSARATDCPRIPPEFLEEERASMGEWKFRQEYLCEFVDGADSFFSREDVERAVSGEVAPLWGSQHAAQPDPAVSADLAPLFGDEA
jgi:hypothetical protein